MKKSLEFFQAFHDEFGVRVFTSTGWLFLVPSEAAEAFDTNMARLAAEGVDTWAVSVEDAAEELPGLNTDGIARVAFEPESGYADPGATVRALVAAGEAAGNEGPRGQPGDRHREQRRQDHGQDRRRRRRDASGGQRGRPLGLRVGQWMGLDLPLEISREQDVVVRPPDGAPKLRRCVSNMVDRIYMRPTPDGAVLAGAGHPKENEPVDPDSYDRAADAEFMEETRTLLARRFPALAGAEVAHGWAGLYTITPDWNMILDRSPRQRGPLPGRGRQRPLLQDRAGHGTLPGRDDSARQVPNRRHLSAEGGPLRQRRHAPVHLRRQQGLVRWPTTSNIW